MGWDLAFLCPLWAGWAHWWWQEQFSVLLSFFPNAGRSGMWTLKCHRSLQNADSRMPGITGVGSERGDWAIPSSAKNSLWGSLPGTQWQAWNRRHRCGVGWVQATWGVSLKTQPSGGWGRGGERSREGLVNRQIVCGFRAPKSRDTKNPDGIKRNKTYTQKRRGEHLFQKIWYSLL